MNAPGDEGEASPPSEPQQQRSASSAFSTPSQRQLSPQKQQQPNSSSGVPGIAPPPHSAHGASRTHDQLAPLPGSRHTGGKPRQSDGAALLSAPRHPMSSSFQVRGAPPCMKKCA